MNFKEEGPRTLLFEGINDGHVISALLQKHSVKKSFGLYECGSDDKVLKRLSALIAGSSAMEVIGIVVDSDNPNLHSKWASITSRLQKEAYIVPKRPCQKGTFFEKEGGPKIGVWLMPDNISDGMLEDFCKQLACQESIKHAKKCVEKAKELGYTTFIENHLSKATIHTLLAWQDEPGMPLGRAITANSLDGNKSAAKDFLKFINELFN